MKTFKKIISIAFCAFMLFAFAACSQPKGKLVMATNAEFPPYEYHERLEGGKILGIDAEIAAAIADKLGMELVIEDMEFSSVIAAVQSGRADMAMAGLTVTEDRLKNVNFTVTYAIGKQVIIVPEDSDISNVDDLEGRKTGVQENTTGDIYVADDFGNEAVVRYAKGAEAVLALTQGKVDAVVIDNEPAKVFVEQNTGLKILETEYVVEEYAIAVAKNNDELLNKINKALKELIDSGTVQSILDKYITAK